jgi:hypothetical protein
MCYTINGIMKAHHVNLGVSVCVFVYVFNQRKQYCTGFREIECEYDVTGNILSAYSSASCHQQYQHGGQVGPSLKLLRLLSSELSQVYSKTNHTKGELVSVQLICCSFL